MEAAEGSRGVVRNDFVLQSVQSIYTDRRGR